MEEAKQMTSSVISTTCAYDMSVPADNTLILYPTKSRHLFMKQTTKAKGCNEDFDQIKPSFYGNMIFGTVIINLKLNCY